MMTRADGASVLAGWPNHPWLVIGWMAAASMLACSPPVTETGVRCGAGTVRDPRTQTCIVGTDPLRCGPGTRLDERTQVCVVSDGSAECGPGTAATPDGRGCVEVGTRRFCDRGTQRNDDRTQCVLTEQDAPTCGEGTRVGFDRRCTSIESLVELERVDDGSLSFDIQDAQIANETVAHLLDVENNRVARVDLANGAVLDAIPGRMQVRWMEVLPDTGDVFLVHGQRIDVYREATGETALLTTTLASITSTTRVGDRLLVTTGDRFDGGTGLILDLRSGERLSSWPLGRHEYARGIHVPAHDTVFLSQTGNGPASLYKIDLSQDAPEIQAAPYLVGISRPGPLHYIEAEDALATAGGHLSDPETLGLKGGVGLNIVDLVERADGLAVLSTGRLNDQPSAFFVVLDRTGNRLSETRIGDEPRRLLMVSGQLHMFVYTDDHLEILRTR